MDDPTIRRCISFASSWGFGSMEVVNLFAFRTKNPVELLAAKNASGPQNVDYLLEYAAGNNTIVCAWGNENVLRKLGSVNGKDLLPPAIRKGHSLPSALPQKNRATEGLVLNSISAEKLSCETSFFNRVALFFEN